MATLLTSTFPADKEGEALLKKVKIALAHICGHGVSKTGSVLTAPRRLKAGRDNLKSDYREIWKKCTIEYDPEETGASVLMKTYQIRLGPFFLRPSIKIVDLEEVLLHEFLHVALNIGNREFHHGMMTQILKYNLGYKEDSGIFMD
jgi:hypothetical protein